MEIDDQNELEEMIKVSYPIPFYSQRVDFNDVHLQGFRSIHEAEHWQVRGCGIASIKMVIDGFQKHRGLKLSDPYGELVYKGVEKGAHCDRGWIHKGLVKIANDYKVQGQAFRQSKVSDVLFELEKNRPCIASVTAGFTGGKINSDGVVIPTGGHLIVVVGAVRDNRVLKGFIVNHPSSAIELNWENHVVDIEDFKNSFSGAFMSFWIKQEE
ncbi:C39 family peptidase [Gorillibacterium massiliense]|uniref:C39 family peptidase n=1 Tax=Gorillibacterium massiliense TaxID=1280390 RepID=UPI0005952239|nr:C39 family peptidase [Gorillibacterium massiliense]